jgi:uncharacterized protein (TIGR02246 family)
MTDASPDQVLTLVLDGWKAGIANRQPDKVASHFTTGTLFQGFRPEHSVGRQGVADYYASQPQGLTANYKTLDVRQPAPGVIVGYVSVDFGFRDKPTIRVHLTVVLERSDAAWLISHYHVSKVA